MLKGLESAPDDLTILLENAPIDDEPDDDDFDGGLTEALAETELIPQSAPNDWTVLLANVPIDHEPFDPSDLDGDDDEPSVPHEEIMRNLADSST